MHPDFVRICCDIHVKQTPSWYRVYVNDEMFMERTADIDAGKVIRETLTVRAVAGRYLLWARGQYQGKVSVSDICVLAGPARIESDQYIVIE